MILFTMGFTQKSASEFFKIIKDNKVDILIDVRLNNRSQLAGFTKGPDLAFFLNEIANCDYAHELIFAPDKELLDGYKKGSISWEEYTKIYQKLMVDRKAVDYFKSTFMNRDNVLFLCSEAKPLNCHRRLLAEMIASDAGFQIVHL